MTQTPPPLEVKGLEPGLKADIVVGIASYNNARTISRVVEAVDVGLGKYYPGLKSIIVNSDGGSTDNTPQMVLGASVDHRAALISHRLFPVHRITTPYHGIPGKGSAFRTIFKTAVELGAMACCVVDADLRSITPEWVELLLAPVLNEGFDFVAPLYMRHKYDGTITNSIIYPFTRALYGKKIRQPIGGEFGFSGKLAEFYLTQDVWNTDIARFGIDIWMTTEAVAGGFKVCQSYLGAKIHDPKDPGSDLSDMFVQVVGSFMALTEKHYQQWKLVRVPEDIPTFGFKYSVGVVPVHVNIERMIKNFELGAENLQDVWKEFLSAGVVGSVKEISKLGEKNFNFPKELWTSIIYDCMLAFHHKKISADHLMKSLIPLYYGRTASFFIEMRDKTDEESEEAVEDLCREYERQKHLLTENW